MVRTPTIHKAAILRPCDVATFVNTPESNLLAPPLNTFPCLIRSFKKLCQKK